MTGAGTSYPFVNVVSNVALSMAADMKAWNNVAI
jgi:hypothetical protein